MSGGSSSQEPLTAQEAVDRLRERHGVPEDEGWRLLAKAQADGLAPAMRYGVIVVSPEGGVYKIQFY